MSGKKIWDAMGEIDGALVEETGRLLAERGEQGKERMPGNGRRPGVGIVVRIGTMAAMAALVIVLGANYRSVPEESSMQLTERKILVQKAAIPEKIENYIEMDADENMQSEEKKISYDSVSSSKFGKNTDVAAVFYEESLREVFLNHTGENIVYSPVNLYLTLGILSEMGSGDTRREILDVMGEEDLGEIREKCKDLWSRLCWRENTFRPILGQSIWMGEGISYSEEMVKILAEQHYASSFQGVAGAERAQAMEDWLEDFLMSVPCQESRGEVSQKTFDLLSVTAYGKEWRGGEGFDRRGTEKRTFYQKDGEEREVSFLRGTVQGKNVTAAKRYCSVDLELTEGSRLSVYLPEKGVDLEEILQKDLKRILSHSGKGDNEGEKEERMAVSLPKFEVTSDISLNGELRKMGVQDAFQEGVADFSPLIVGRDGEASEEETSIAAGEIRQSARIVLNEGGCGTESRSGTESAGEEKDGDGKSGEKSIVCDRPFLYIIWDQEGVPVLAGTVNTFE